MNIKRVLSVCLAGCLMVGCIGPVSAEEGAAVIDGKGTSSAVLTAEPLTLSVTVPMTLPINVDADGNVTVADNAKIINKSAGPVKVKGVKVEAVAPWTLAEYADLSGEVPGAHKVGIAIQGKGATATSGTCAATFDTIAAKGETALTYDAKVAPQSEAVNNTEIAKVVFTVDWDDGYKDFEVTQENRDTVGYIPGVPTDLVIPSTFQDTDGINYKVTSIGYKAFWDYDGLTSVTILDSVISIGEGAFGSCDYIKSITIPDSVTSIGKEAFNSCTSLTSITLPESLTSIGDYAFISCRSLTSITIPGSVTSIGTSAFLFCDSLTSITYKDATYNSVAEFSEAFGAIEGNIIGNQSE